MRVKELIKQLSSLNQESEIILQKDGEGNGYSPLKGLDSDAIYVPDSTWSGDVYSLEWSADDCCFEEEYWQKIKNQTPVVVMFPVN